MKLIDLHEAEARSILSVMWKQDASYDGNFDCESKKLTSLEGAPSTVHGDFYCTRNLLVSLKGAPNTVLGDFFCADNELTSLEGVPHTIDGDFYCSGNKLTSLHNIHKHIKHLKRHANFDQNPIKSNVLGLLMIDGLKRVSLGNSQLQNILNKHLQGDRDVFACQEELIEAGFPEFAKP